MREFAVKNGLAFEPFVKPEHSIDAISGWKSWEWSLKGKYNNHDVSAQLVKVGNVSQGGIICKTFISVKNSNNIPVEFTMCRRPLMYLSSNTQELHIDTDEFYKKYLISGPHKEDVEKYVMQPSIKKELQRLFNEEVCDLFSNTRIIKTLKETYPATGSIENVLRSLTNISINSLEAKRP